MSRFTKRLARTQVAIGGGREERSAPTALSGEAAPSGPVRPDAHVASAHTGELAAQVTRPPPTPRAERLASLRQRLVKLVGASPPPPPPPIRSGELPFDTVATPFGQLHVRTVFVTPAQTVGSVGLAGALRADPLMLSLLGLAPEVAGCDVRRAVFLDAETTGLGNGTGNYPFLMGVCGVTDGAFVVQQYLLRDPDDEPALLARLHQHIEGASLLVSYNGKSFDLPLLRNRFVMNGLAAPNEPPHLDLLHVARRIHKRRRFRKSLTTLECEVLGFRRGPNDVAGAEVAARYLHYLHTRNEAELVDVVEHNELDVLTLVALTALYGEPLRRLEAEELASAADVILRAGDLERARSVADEAVRRGATEAGLLSRAHINKARGDKERALADFERLAARVDDPEVRLELAKLYEHYVRDHARALAVTTSGTGEAGPDHARRMRRLRRKVEGRVRVESAHGEGVLGANARGESDGQARSSRSITEAKSAREPLEGRTLDSRAAGELEAAEPHEAILASSAVLG